ncbi:MAG: NADH-quinone oxidoreductase subunit [Acidimicrobiaceae bacterium]
MSSAEDVTVDTAPETPTDEVRTALLSELTEELGDAVVDSHLRPGDDLWVRVATEAWGEAGHVARTKLGYDYFCFLSAIDWRPSPFGRYEDAEVDSPLADKLNQPFELQQGLAGGETRFQVIARVTDTRRHVGVTLKTDVPDDSLTVPTWVHAYAGADWHERETWEMFGILFAGHPGLRHIYLPTEFEGFPLRKDFPLLARVVKPWPGIVDVEPMPGEDPEATDDDAAAAEAEADA